MIRSALAQLLLWLAAHVGAAQDLEPDEETTR